MSTMSPLQPLTTLATGTPIQPLVRNINSRSFLKGSCDSLVNFDAEIFWSERFEKETGKLSYSSSWRNYHWDPLQHLERIIKENRKSSRNNLHTSLPFPITGTLSFLTQEWATQACPLSKILVLHWPASSQSSSSSSQLSYSFSSSLLAD